MCLGWATNRDLCRSIKVLFTQSTREPGYKELTPFRRKEKPHPKSSPQAHPTTCLATARAIIKNNCHPLGINDNKRTSRTSYQLLPPLDFSRFHRTFPDFPDHIRIPSPFPQTRSWRVWCSFVTNGNIWPNGFKWPRTLVSHAIKSFCSMNAFSAASNNLRHTLKSMDRSKSQLAWCVMCFGKINPFHFPLVV